MRVGAMTVLIALIAASTISVLVLAGIGMERVQNLPQPLALSPAPDSLNAVEITLPEVDSLSENDLLERPLFWEGRRPVVAELDKDKDTTVEALGPDPFEKVKLVGVYSGGAIFLVDGVMRRIQHSEELDGWTLELADVDSVMFVREAQPKVLFLEHAVVIADPGKVQKQVNAKTAADRARARRKDNAKAAKPADLADPDDPFSTIDVEVNAAQDRSAAIKPRNRNSAYKPPGKGRLPKPQMR